MKSGIILVATVALLMAGCIPLIGAEAADAGFDITDGNGQTFHFDAPAERVVTSGYAVTLTIAQAGEIDKIVAADKYSMYDYYKDEDLKDLNAKNLGSFYGTSNDDSILIELVNMVEAGELYLDDPILLTNYDDNESLRKLLVNAGFTKVLMWGETHDYSEVMDIVVSASKIVTGTEPESVIAMQNKVDAIREGVSGISDEDKAKALYVWYYNGQFQIGSEGIMGSMLEICGANNIGFVEGKDRYGDAATIITLLEQNPGTTVFVSSSYFNGKTVDDFYKELFGGDRTFRVIEMDSQWNNICPESADGLVAISQCLYPDIFGEYDDGYTGGSDDGVPVYYLAIAGAVIVVAIALIAVVMRRKP